MSGNQAVTYALDFRSGRPGRWENKIASSHLQPPAGERAGGFHRDRCRKRNRRTREFPSRVVHVIRPAHFALYVHP